MSSRVTVQPPSLGEHQRQVRQCGEDRKGCELQHGGVHFASHLSHWPSLWSRQWS